MCLISDAGVMKMKQEMLALLKHRYENMESNEFMPSLLYWIQDSKCEFSL